MGASIWGYLGPDTILPATSVLAAVGGVILAFWGHVTGGVARAVRFLLRRPAPPAAQDRTD